MYASFFFLYYACVIRLMKAKERGVSINYYLHMNDTGPDNYAKTLLIFISLELVLILRTNDICIL